jgi:hypothetical protein
MPNVTSQLTVRLIDAVSAPARAVAQAIRGIGTAVDQTNAKRLTLGGAITRMRTEVAAAARDFKRHADDLSRAVSLPVSILTGFGARAVYEYQKVGNAVQAVTGMTDEQRASLEAYGQELNKLFPFTNKEIMQAAFELARAGLNFEQVMGTLRESLNLALAGDIGLGESADIATNVLTAMRLPMETAEQAMQSLIRVNDALAYAAVRSNTDIRMMGDTFKYVGPMAAAAGMSIEEVTAAAMVMANNGIRASEAGVALRSALVRMVKPTKPMLRALEQLNINLDDFVKRGREITAQDVVSSLQVDGIDASQFAAQIEEVLKDPALKGSIPELTTRLVEIIAGDGSVVDKSVLAEAITETLTAAGAEVDFFGFLRALKEKGADIGHIANVFDARQGSRLITLLAGNLEQVLAEVIEQAAGATQRMASTRMKGIVGDVAALAAAFDNLFQAIAKSGVLQTARQAIEWLTGALEDMAKSNPKLLETATYATLAVAAIGPLGILLGGVASALMLLGTAAMFFLRTAGNVGAMAGLGAGAGAAAAGAAGAAAAGAQASRGLMSRVLGWAGIAGTAWGIKELLGAIDPKGNLWGLTEGIDNWFERNFGFNPSRIGGEDNRLAEIQAKLDAIESEASGERTVTERAKIEADASGAQSAAHETMSAYGRQLDKEFAEHERKAREHVKRMLDILNFTAAPRIAPRVDGSTLRGVHADVGVE